MRKVLAGLVLLVAVPALADAPKGKPAEEKPAIVIKNTFGFDYMKPKKACAKITGALEKTIGKMTCVAVPEGGTASQRPAVADCKNAKETSGYLLFVKKEDCEEERKTQLANGEG